MNAYSHISHEHRGAQPPGMQGMNDLWWYVGVVGNGGGQVHPTGAHVLPPTPLLTSSHALQRTPGMFTVRVLKLPKHSEITKECSQKTEFSQF